MKFSPELENKFECQSVESSKEKYEHLCELGINPEFANQLAQMFEGINASAQEVMDVQPDIVSAQARVSHTSERHRTSAYRNLATQIAANDDDYSQAA